MTPEEISSIYKNEKNTTSQTINKKQNATMAQSSLLAKDRQNFSSPWLKYLSNLRLGKKYTSMDRNRMMVSSRVKGAD